MKFIYKIYSISKLIFNIFFLKYFFNSSDLLIYYRNKIYSPELLKLINDKNKCAKYFVIENFNHDFDILKSIDLYPKTKNDFDNKNINTYQSDHNIHKDNLFYSFSISLEKFLNSILIQEYHHSILKIEIIKMWFVISNQSAIINPHNHLDGHISGVLYPKNKFADRNGLILYNQFNKIQKITFSNDNLISKNFIKDSIIKESSSENKLIIFDSFIMHSVDQVYLGDDFSNKRISLAWDAIFKLKNS